MPAEMLIRPERPADTAEVYTINELAFGRPDEARLVDLLRPTKSNLLSLVAENNESVIAHCLFTKIEIRREAQVVAHGAGLGPIAVHPAFQRTGIGSALIRHGLNTLEALGTSFVVVLGHPAYYPRFGFEISLNYDIRSQRDTPPEVFMVKELAPGALKSISGVAFYAPEFEQV